MRIDPPPSDPVASGTRPAATAAADPPDEPPAERSSAHGLRVAPNVALTVSAFQPSSGVFVLPTTTQPGGPEALDERRVGCRRADRRRRRRIPGW